MLRRIRQQVIPREKPGKPEDLKRSIKYVKTLNSTGKVAMSENKFRFR